MIEPQAKWQERYEGGSAEAERERFEQLAQAMMAVQLDHPKTREDPDRPTCLPRQGALLRERRYARLSRRLTPRPLHRFCQARRRLSNYRAHLQRPRDQPGGRQARHARHRAAGEEFAPGQTHDLLATNFPVSHARNARQFVAFAKATAGGPISTLCGIASLWFTFGARETLRMFANVLKARNRKVASLALETFWSRGAICWGEGLPVRYLIRPAPGTRPGPRSPGHDPNYLSRELNHRLEAGDVHFQLCLQRFVDEHSTPIEDTAVEWMEQVSAPVPVAVLTIRKPNVGTAEAIIDGRVVEELAFNPWNTSPEHRPLGNLNRARKAVYDAGSAHRLGYRWLTLPPVRNQLLSALARAIFRGVNHFIPWYKLSVRLSLLNLDGFRYVLRRQNLIDTEVREAPPQTRTVPAPPPEEDRRTRTADGTNDDVSAREMGALGLTSDAICIRSTDQSFSTPRVPTSSLTSSCNATRSFPPPRSTFSRLPGFSSKCTTGLTMHAIPWELKMWMLPFRQTSPGTAASEARRSTACASQVTRASISAHVAYRQATHCRSISRTPPPIGGTHPSSTVRTCPGPSNSSRDQSSKSRTGICRSPRVASR